MGADAVGASKVTNNLRPDEIEAILTAGNFNALIGEVENERLECKAAPYQLEHDHQKLELAKDVSGLANAEGGVILIGVRTERSPTHFGDEISEVRVFPRTLVDPNRYHDILQTWVYPTLRDIQIRWFPSAHNQEGGLVAIFISSQSMARRPILVTKTVDDTGRRVEAIFGYFERRQADVAPMSVHELQSLLRDGLRFESLNQPLGIILETLQRPQGERAPEVPQIRELLDGRLEGALTTVGLQQVPAFILTAVPTDRVEIPSLFETREAAIVRLLEQPPELHPAGFGLRTGAPAAIVRGELRQTVARGRKILELWRDGTLIFAATGGANFLCWSSIWESLRINQMVLIESTYLFADLSRLVVEHEQPRTGGIDYRLELRNMTVGERPCSLMPGPLDHVRWIIGNDVQYAPDSSRVFCVKAREADLDPGNVSFLLVSQVYQWFGIEHDQIPYTERVGGRLVVSPARIRAAR